MTAKPLLRGRTPYGGTLALAVACAVILIIIGVGFFVLMKLMGGERELNAATDAGGLNIAKQAIAHPSIALQDGIEKENFESLGDPSLNDEINLRSFDRLYAKMLMVYVNSKLDPGQNQLGKDHAEELAKAFEGDDSVGKRLCQQFYKQAKQVGWFKDVAFANSTRMYDTNLNSGDKFELAFTQQNPTDVGATNVEVDQNQLAWVPPELVTKDEGKYYLRGYLPLRAGSQPFAGVPTQPEEQPHKIAERDFEAQKKLPAGLEPAFVPPNSFKSHGEVKTEFGKASSISFSQIGALKDIYQFAVPNGYVEIINGPGPDGGGPGNMVAGPFGKEPGERNHVLNNELLNPGVVIVNGGAYFSTNRGLIDEWARYNKAVAEGQDPLPPKPSVQGLFIKDGSPATDGSGIPWDAAGTADKTSLCRDTNVTGINPASVNPLCAALWNDGRGAFDRAYFPVRQAQGRNDATDTRANRQKNAYHLMSIECTKCKLIQMFWNCGQLSAAGCNPTGLRTFKRDVELPWLPDSGTERCIVSQAATIPTLFEFVEPGSWTKALNGKGPKDPRSIKGRIRQIKPEAKDDEIESLFTSEVFDMGTKGYIYLKPGTKTLILSKTPPKYFADSDDLQDDGTPIEFTKSYPLVGTLVNPHFENGISEILYREGPQTDTLVGTDSARWVPCTGFHGLLGRIRLINTVTGKAEIFCKPN